MKSKRETSRRWQMNSLGISRTYQALGRAVLTIPCQSRAPHRVTAPSLFGLGSKEECWKSRNRTLKKKAQWGRRHFDSGLCVAHILLSSHESQTPATYRSAFSPTYRSSVHEYPLTFPRIGTLSLKPPVAIAVSPNTVNLTSSYSHVMFGRFRVASDAALFISQEYEESGNQNGGDNPNG